MERKHCGDEQLQGTRSSSKAATQLSWAGSSRDCLRKQRADSMVSNLLGAYGQVRHAFEVAEKVFGYKKYFVKFDDDALILPGPLLRFLRELDASSTMEPLYFGKANCATVAEKRAGDFSNLCYAAGAVYGMNLEALKYLNEHQRRGCGYFQELEDEIVRGRTINDVKNRFEDVM